MHLCIYLVSYHIYLFIRSLITTKTLFHTIEIEIWVFGIYPYIVLWAIISVWSPMKGNTLYILRALTRVCLPKNGYPFWKPFQHIIELYSQTSSDLWKHVPPYVLASSRKIRRIGKGNSILTDSLMYLWSKHCPTF